MAVRCAAQLLLLAAALLTNAPGAQRGGPEPGRRLPSSVSSPSSVTRASAAEACGARNDVPAARVAERIADFDAGVRKAARSALRRRGESGEAAAAAALDSSDPNCRAAAAQTLAELHGFDYGGEIARLLTDGKPQVRGAAMAPRTCNVFSCFLSRNIICLCRNY